MKKILIAFSLLVVSSNIYSQPFSINNELSCDRIVTVTATDLAHGCTSTYTTYPIAVAANTLIWYGDWSYIPSGWWVTAPPSGTTLIWLSARVDEGDPCSRSYSINVGAACTAYSSTNSATPACGSCSSLETTDFSVDVYSGTLLVDIHN